VGAECCLTKVKQFLWGEVVKIAANHIEGKSQREGETMGEKWSYEVAFNSSVMKQGKAR